MNDTGEFGANGIAIKRKNDEVRTRNVKLFVQVRTVTLNQFDIKILNI